MHMLYVYKHEKVLSFAIETECNVKILAWMNKQAQSKAFEMHMTEINQEHGSSFARVKSPLSECTNMTRIAIASICMSTIIAQ